MFSPSVPTERGLAEVLTQPSTCLGAAAKPHRDSATLAALLGLASTDESATAFFDRGGSLVALGPTRRNRVYVYSAKVLGTPRKPPLDRGRKEVGRISRRSAKT